MDGISHKTTSFLRVQQEIVGRMCVFWVLDMSSRCLAFRRCFGWKMRFNTGTPLRYILPVLYRPDGALRLSCFTRHFGRRLGITNKFVLLSACSKIGLRGHAWADGMVTLLRSSIRSNVSLQGLRFPAFCFARNRAAPRQRLCMHNSALGLLRHPCLYSAVTKGLFVCLVLQDILGGTSG